MNKQEMEQYNKTMTELSEKVNEAKSFCTSHAEESSTSIPLQRSLTEKWIQLSTIERQINIELRLLQRNDK